MTEIKAKMPDDYTEMSEEESNETGGTLSAASSFSTEDWIQLGATVIASIAVVGTAGYVQNRRNAQLQQEKQQLEAQQTAAEKPPVIPSVEKGYTSTHGIHGDQIGQVDLDQSFYVIK